MRLGFEVCGLVLGGTHIFGCITIVVGDLVARLLVLVEGLEGKIVICRGGWPATE